MDIRDLHMNNMVAKGVRATHDETLKSYMKNELQKILENDQICFVQPESGEPGKVSATFDIQNKKLREAQLEHFNPIFTILKDEFNINLNIFE